MEEEKTYPKEKVAAVKAKCKELEKELTGDYSKDYETLKMIDSLRSSVGLYVSHFDDSGDCLYCSG
jgi:hypothetical protein